VEDGGHECTPDLATTQLVFRRMCIGLPYCRLSAEEVVAAMAPHVPSACGAHVMSPRIIAQCRPLNLPLPLRQMVPQGDWFLGIHVETRTRDEDFPIAITTAAHMRAMFYSSDSRFAMPPPPMPPPAPPSLCHFKWYKLVIDEVRGGPHNNNIKCALSGVRFHDEHGAIMKIHSAANPKGSSPARHGAATLVDLSADTRWVDTTYYGVKSCEVEFTMTNYGAPASVMLCSADEFFNDPVAYTLLGRGTVMAAWQELAAFTPHREFMAPEERFSAYSPMASNCVQPDVTGGNGNAALGLHRSDRMLLGSSARIEYHEGDDEKDEEQTAEQLALASVSADLGRRYTSFYRNTSWACAGRNELPAVTGINVAQAKVICYDISSCVSFEKAPMGSKYRFSTT
jgi:hypothetical protein